MENNENKNISFVIPTFNCSKTIEESIDSILDTNFKEGDEIIIVDDKSTDNTLEIIQKLSLKNQSIKIIKHTSNLGGGATRNTAVKNSKNNLIFCLDSDNILEKDSINKLKDFLISTKSDVASFNRLKFFKENIKSVTHQWKFFNGEIKLLDLFCSQIVPSASGNYLFTKESWENAGGYPDNAGALDTWGFGFRQLATESKMIVMPNSYYFHRYGHNSYWERESRDGKISLLATEIIKPYTNLIKKDILSYIEKNKNEWFNNRENIPNIKCGNVGKSILPLKGILKMNINLMKKFIPSFIKKLIKKVYLYIGFTKDFFDFKKKLIDQSRFQIRWKDINPQLFNKRKGTSFDAHYLYHPAWAIRIISKINPVKHTDISSIFGFSTMLSAFIPVELYEYQPTNIKLSNLILKKADLTSLPFNDNSIISLSCMHTVEHVGLGRYGDPIDPYGDIKAMKELSRVLAKNGNFLFVVPIGKPKIEFNANRIYSYNQIISSFQDLVLKEFSLIPDNATTEGMIYNASKELADEQVQGCGCFWFTKN